MIEEWRPISSRRVKEVSWYFQRSTMRMSQAIIQSKDELHKNEHLRKTIEELKEDLI
jgi:hypothetical protein